MDVRGERAVLTDLLGQVSQPSRRPCCEAQVHLSGCPESLPFSLSPSPSPISPLCLTSFPALHPSPPSHLSLVGLFIPEPLLLQGDGKPWLQTSAILIFPADRLKWNL